MMSDLLTNNRSSAEPTKTPIPLVLPAPLCFYFESDRAGMNHGEMNITEFKVFEEKDKKYFKTQADKQKRLIRMNKNHENLDKLVSVIQQNKSHDFPRITLIGRTDEKQPGDFYHSNYQLSEARNQTTKNEIIKRIYNDNKKKSQYIDWILIAQSNEDTITPQLNENSVNTQSGKDIETLQADKDDKNQKTCLDSEDLEYYTETAQPVGKDEKGNKVLKDEKGKERKTVLDLDSRKRVVEVSLSMVSPDAQSTQTREFWENQEKESEKNKYKQPNLMDYMYFSIYTITTTGYGDIKPATRDAKFLVSLENFFEVFFLVCFMNTLIALKRGKDND